MKNLSAQFGMVDIKAGNIGAGAGGGFGLNAPGTGPKPKSFAGSATPSGFSVADDLKVGVIVLNLDFFYKLTSLPLLNCHCLI